MKKENKKVYFAVIISLIVGIALGLIFGGNTFQEKAGICSPELFCLEDTVAYRSLTCGLLINTNPETAGVCSNGQFVEESPLVRTSFSGGQKIVLIETEMLDLQENQLRWTYYPKGEADLGNIQASPQEVSIEIPLVAKQ
ncbi:MAG: hypothetical protein ABH864_07280 [archaeon]